MSAKALTSVEAPTVAEVPTYVVEQADVEGVVVIVTNINISIKSALFYDLICNDNTKI